jgi:hypothetical protein
VVVVVVVVVVADLLFPDQIVGRLGGRTFTGTGAYYI